MDIAKLLPVLWKLIKKHKCVINIATIDNALTVTLLGKRKVKQFSNTDSGQMLHDLSCYLQE